MSMRTPPPPPSRVSTRAWSAPRCIPRLPRCRPRSDAPAVPARASRAVNGSLEAGDDRVLPTASRPTAQRHPPLLARRRTGSPSAFRRTHENAAAPTGLRLVGMMGGRRRQHDAVGVVTADLRHVLSDSRHAVTGSQFLRATWVAVHERHNVHAFVAGKNRKQALRARRRRNPRGQPEMATMNAVTVALNDSQKSRAVARAGLGFEYPVVKVLQRVRVLCDAEVFGYAPAPSLAEAPPQLGVFGHPTDGVGQACGIVWGDQQPRLFVHNRLAKAPQPRSRRPHIPRPWLRALRGRAAQRAMAPRRCRRRRPARRSRRNPRNRNRLSMPATPTAFSHVAQYGAAGSQVVAHDDDTKVSGHDCLQKTGRPHQVPDTLDLRHLSAQRHRDVRGPQSYRFAKPEPLVRVERGRRLDAVGDSHCAAAEQIGAACSVSSRNAFEMSTARENGGRKNQR